MHGTFKKIKELQKAPDLEPKLQDTPDFIGPDWWLHKAMYDPSGDPLRQIFSPSSP
jgi:hypothetical protein